MACIDDFKNHRWNEAGICERCGTAQAAAASDPAPVTDGVESQPVGTETLEDVQKDLTAKKEQKKKPKAAGKNKEKQKAEEDLDKAIAASNAADIVDTIESLKSMAAKYGFGFEGEFPKIESDERKALVGQLQKYFEVTGFKIESPKALAVMMLLTEARVTGRQFAEISRASKP